MGDFDRQDSDESGDEDSWKDSTHSGRDGAIFLVEISPEMFQKREDEEDNFLQLALRCSHSMIVNKVFSSSSDYVGVVLFGTEKSRGTSASNVYVLQEMALPGAPAVLDLEHVFKGDLDEFRREIGISSKFALEDALFQCLSMFTNTDKTHKLHSKRVLLFTSRDRPADAGSVSLRRHVHQKVKDVRDNDIALDLFPLGKTFDMASFYSEVLFDSASDERPPTADVSDKLEELLARVRQKSYKKRVLGKIPFVLGEGLKLAVGVYNLIRPSTKPPSVLLEKNTNQPVSSISTYVAGERTLHRSEINHCQKVGDRQIAFSSDEVRELRAICEPGLVLLGFQPASHLDPLQHVQPASFIYPEETWIKGSRQLFAALLRCCSERALVAICRLVARRNDTPHLVALQPQPQVVSDGVQTAPPGFHVIYLPFADDVRQLSLPAPRRATDEQIEAARAIVTKLRFNYAPEKIENPQLQKHWINIEALALNRPDVDEFTDYTAPDVERIRKKAGPLIEKFQELVYPEGYDPLAKSKPRAPAAKRPKLDPDAVDVRALARDKKVHTTTMPVLKAFLQDAGVSVSGLKKADLVQAVYDQLEQKQ